MEHLFSTWENVKKELRDRYIYLFLDCDGTLAPIADTPDLARIPQQTKEVLLSLSRLEKLKLAIISGRALSDIKAVVGLNGIIYVGNHGLEIEGPGITSEWKIAPSYKENLSEIKAQLTKECSLIPGVLLEDKGLSLCLHYRLASADEGKISVIFHRVTDPYRASGKILTMHGKKVIEIRPAIGWDKGKIVKWLLARERMISQEKNFIGIYVGDDQTDETAFKALGDSGISVVVGHPSFSLAKYCLDDTEQVYQFLTMILKARSD